MVIDQYDKYEDSERRIFLAILLVAGGPSQIAIFLR
jgi:hypothetical protein